MSAPEEPRSRTVRVAALARVEGEGALHIRVRGAEVERVSLEIYEPPRFFEGLLRGRAWTEAPDVTARICGICPVAYQMSAVHALEAGVGAQVTGPLRDLRRLLYCGEWIESHTLHAFMLHAPDFLGYPDAIRMAKDHPERVKAGLEVKKAGNALVALVGGREVHPINVRVGGFYRAPTRAELAALEAPLARARDLALEALAWTATFSYPGLALERELVALRHPAEYPMNEGRIVSTKGLDCAAEEFDQHMVEEQVAHSTALHARLRGRGHYLTGPLARWALARDLLPAWLLEAARAAGLDGPVTDPFRSIGVRLVEVAYACDEAVRLIRAYAPPPAPALALAPRAGSGAWATEAPRGLLWHRYALDDAGAIVSARIVPPTSQNQASIEDDLRALAADLLRDPHLAEDVLARRCEAAVRNHDPCISCSTHFLKLHLERVP
ncbi:MAG: nickel-dependent hydrogenase large subunit [Planctomycetes bacterium]|nr:nickel-dependent hydrogenase large subunit [Planctomycetota bacterium]